MSTVLSSTSRRTVRLCASIIVPHYDQCEKLRSCLQSLLHQTLDTALYEIIVCDNGTAGGLHQIAEEFPDVKIVVEPERGAACARNVGIAIAKGENLAFIDADCVADENWLQSGLSALEETDLVGGEVLTFAENEQEVTAVEAFELIFAFHQKSYVNRKRFSVTANLFARRDVAEAIGPFKNGVSEDLDWCRRAQKLGFRLAFDRTSIVSHPARRDWVELTCKWERLIKERWNGIEGTGAARQIKWLGLAVITALSAAPHLLRVFFSPRISRVQDRLGAAAVLTRIRFWRARRMLAML